MITIIMFLLFAFFLFSFLNFAIFLETSCHQTIR